jgi:signal transduction histidine kinase
MFGLLVIVIDIAAGAIIFISAKAREAIIAGINKISSGNLHHKVNEKHFLGANLVLARAVNQIGDTVSSAVEISMRDERLKADLITNVSHDIKTPLTSIINYIDLIKREKIDNDTINNYIEILDSKSQRLKQLTDDLVEASKISSGNIAFQMERINLTELVNQTIGEFSEKFTARNLQINLKADDENHYIEADSRRIWRVIENLFNNIHKYAMENTRVYIDVVRKDSGHVELSIKNISEQPLNFSPAELTERFIRGDVSRSTEGSGLGLSIAKSLTEAQNGRFEILMDGDLFKVILTFPLLEKD